MHSRNNKQTSIVTCCVWQHIIHVYSVKSSKLLFIIKLNKIVRWLDWVESEAANWLFTQNTPRWFEHITALAVYCYKCSHCFKLYIYLTLLFIAERDRIGQRFTMLGLVSESKSESIKTVQKLLYSKAKDVVINKLFELLELYFLTTTRNMYSLWLDY